jgi:hypothetical protein
MNSPKRAPAGPGAFKPGMAGQRTFNSRAKGFDSSPVRHGHLA